MTGSGNSIFSRITGLHRIAERVAGADVLEAGESDDVAGISFLDVLAVVRVHQKHAADALLLVAGRVQHRRTGLDLARIDAAEGDGADEGVVHDLEGEHGERLFVRRTANSRLLGLEIDALDRFAIGGRRQVSRRRRREAAERPCS